MVDFYALLIQDENCLRIILTTSRGKAVRMRRLSNESDRALLGFITFSESTLFGPAHILNTFRYYLDVEKFETHGIDEESFTVKTSTDNLPNRDYLINRFTRYFAKMVNPNSPLNKN